MPQGTGEIILIFVVIMVIFGSTRLPELEHWTSTPRENDASPKRRRSDVVLLAAAVALGLLALGLALAPR